MVAFPDIKTAEDVTARIRQVIGYLRYSCPMWGASPNTAQLAMLAPR
jgi:hypothetical protein